MKLNTLNKIDSCVRGHHVYMSTWMPWFWDWFDIADKNLIWQFTCQTANLPNLILCQICWPYGVIMHVNNSVVIFIKHLTCTSILPGLHNSHNGSCRVVIFSKVFDLHIYPSPSLVPRPPPFFVLQFAFSIIYRNGRAVKYREALGTPITWMTSGGHKVDVRGGERCMFK